MATVKTFIGNVKGQKGDTGVGVRTIESDGYTTSGDYTVNNIKVEYTDDSTSQFQLNVKNGDKGESGSPKGVDASTNILAFTEDKGIYVGSDTGHWYYWNGTQYADGGVYQATEIADGSVTLDKLAVDVKNELPTISVNLYNYTTAVTVGYYRYGGLNVNDNYRTSEFIPVTPNETIYTNCFGYYNFWTKEKANITNADVINTSNTNLSFTVPANAYFMTVGTTQDNMEQCMVNRGTDYIPHRHYVRLLPPYVASFDLNNYTLPYIKDMKVCCNKTSSTTTAYYAGVEVDEAPTKMTIRWVFEKGTTGGTVALISNPNGLAKVSDITQNSLHLTINDNGIRLTCLGEKYGQYYYCDIINVTFTDKLLTDGVTENTAEMEILANANVVRLKVNGVNYSGSFTDTLSQGVTLNDFVGKYCTFEHYCYGDRDTFAMPQFTYFEVLTDNMKVMDNFKRENSQLTTTPTGQVYHLMSDRFQA